MSKISMMHDIKPDRPDLSPPLPTLLMLLPAMFYLSAAGAVGLGALFTIKTKQAQANEQREMDGVQDVGREITSLKAEQKVIDETFAKAREVESWIDSTQPLMSVVTAVVNSVKEGNTLSSLRLSRAGDNPTHIDMRVQINTGGTLQKEETVQALVKEGYQTFKDDTIVQDKNERLGDVTYTATLVKNKSSEE